jgi:ubiquitin thioesterase OTU1
MEHLIPIRRLVDADNSCLFSSIAYLNEINNFNIYSSLKYRNMIVEYLLNNDFDESLLGLPKYDYINEINNPSKWGGGIEIKIFTDILKLEIAVVDVQTNRIDLFGQNKDYTSRIYLLYNGIHYDPLVMNYSIEYDNTSDITIFDSDDNNVYNQFKELIKKINDSGDYVDISKLKSLKCSECQEIFINQDYALNHANQSYHWNFIQI